MNTRSVDWNCVGSDFPLSGHQRPGCGKIGEVCNLVLSPPSLCALVTDRGAFSCLAHPPPKTLRVFGHFSLRSEWQLVKVDYKSIFSRRCNKEDFQTWHLLNQVQGRVEESWVLEIGATASFLVLLDHPILRRKVASQLRIMVDYGGGSGAHTPKSSRARWYLGIILHSGILIFFLKSLSSLRERWQW